MGGYVKVWTEILHDEKFLSLNGGQRGIYLQLLMECKDQSDSGHVYLRSYSQAAHRFGSDDSTITRTLLRLHSVGLIKMERDKNNIIHIELPNYLYWQRVTPNEVLLKKRQTTQSPLSRASNTSLSRAEQSRAKQSRADQVVAKSDGHHKRVVTYFCESYEKRFGVKYDFKSAKDGATIKRLLGVFGAEPLQKLIDQLFVSRDSFIESSDHSIGVLSACANKLMQELSRRKTFLDDLSPEGRKTAMNALELLKEKGDI